MSKGKKNGKTKIRFATTEQRNALVEQNLGLAHKLARKYFKGAIELDDLLQEAFIGLVEAADRWEPERGAFSTCAYVWMNSRLLLASKRHYHAVYVPNNRRESWSKIRKMADNMSGTKETKVGKTAQNLSVSIAEVEEALIGEHSISLFSNNGKDKDALRLLNILPDPLGVSPETMAMAKEVFEQACSNVQSVLLRLPPLRNAHVYHSVFLMRYGFDDQSLKPKILDDVGDAHGFTGKRADQRLKYVWSILSQRIHRNEEWFLAEIQRVRALSELLGEEIPKLGP